MSLLNNLISYYKFDTDANDSVSANNGFVTGASLISGKINNGYLFTSGNYIDCKYAFNMGVDNFCISFWIKKSNLAITAQIICGNRNFIGGPSQIGYHILLQLNRLYCIIEDATTPIILDTGYIFDLNWHHVVINIDRNNFMTCWVDTVEINKINISTIKNNSINNGNKFYFGKRSDIAFPGDWLNATLDEFGIWRSLFTKNDILELYNDGNGLQYSFGIEPEKEIQKITDYNYNLNLMIQQYKDKPKFKAILEANNVQANDLETALFEIRDNFWIETAEGVQLDTIGIIVNEKRLGRNDTDYRDAIKSRIIINNGSGEPEIIIFAFTNFYNAGVVHILNIGSGNLQIRVDILITQEIFNFFLDIIGAGIGLIITTGNDHPFGFSSDITLGSETNIWGFAEDTNPTDVNAGDFQTVYNEA